jgi:hypothetical protein
MRYGGGSQGSDGVRDACGLTLSHLALGVSGTLPIRFFGFTVTGGLNALGIVATQRSPPGYSGGHPGSPRMERWVGGRMDKVNLSQKFSLFTSHWDPKIVGEVNGHHGSAAALEEDARHGGRGERHGDSRHRARSAHARALTSARRQPRPAETERRGRPIPPPRSTASSQSNLTQEFGACAPT